MAILGIQPYPAGPYQAPLPEMRVIDSGRDLAATAVALSTDASIVSILSASSAETSLYNAGGLLDTFTEIDSLAPVEALSIANGFDSLLVAQDITENSIIDAEALHNAQASFYMPDGRMQPSFHGGPGPEVRGGAPFGGGYGGGHSISVWA